MTISSIIDTMILMFVLFAQTRWRHDGDTMATRWRHDGDTMAPAPRHDGGLMFPVYDGAPRA